MHFKLLVTIVSLSIINCAHAALEIEERYNDASDAWGVWIRNEHDKYWDNITTKEEAKKRNQVCGDYTYGKGDAATWKTYGYVDGVVQKSCRY
ncbi:uncharacterized protein LOC126265725 isoform X2 [Aethina tumida]|uniref:uncharacterized protein LOC126265725 isoform X2 n=1 Tax=Aethina tumida TaxID=116153 RepID=UPI002148AAEA|nr:uncharacterized protein LOC126265725 isoform X2 [Aethina tumida]